MKIDPANVTRWKHKFGFHNRGVMWDTLMTKWAGEENDWMQMVVYGIRIGRKTWLSLF